MRLYDRGEEPSFLASKDPVRHVVWLVEESQARHFTIGSTDFRESELGLLPESTIHHLADLAEMTIPDVQTFTLWTLICSASQSIKRLIAKTVNESSEEKLDAADAVELKSKRRYVTGDDADLLLRAGLEAGTVRLPEFSNVRTLAKKLKVDYRTLEQTQTFVLQRQRLESEKAERKRKYKQ